MQSPRGTALERVSRRGLCECRRKSAEASRPRRAQRSRRASPSWACCPPSPSPLLSSVVGEAIDVDGDFWEGRLSAQERATKYKCPGNLADPNINSHYLAKLTRVGINKAVFRPSKDAIQARYYVLHQF